MKTRTYVVSALLFVSTLPCQQLLYGQTAGLMLIADRHAVGRPGLNAVVDAGAADALLAYAKNPSSLVHGLVGSVAADTKLRYALLEADQTDRITVSIRDGTHLPFVENTVNQIVCDKVTDEIRRALAPYGVAVTPDGKSLWTKPYPKEMEWPQYLHQASGNCVSQDMIVGPPRRIQWVGAPRTSRHHDHLSCLSAMVVDFKQLSAPTWAENAECAPRYRLMSRAALVPGSKRRW